MEDKISPHRGYFFNIFAVTNEYSHGSQEAKLQERPKNQSCCTHLVPGQPGQSIYFWKAYSMGNMISAVVRHLEWQKFFFRPSTIGHYLHFPDILRDFYITNNYTLYCLNNLLTRINGCELFTGPPKGVSKKKKIKMLTSAKFADVCIFYIFTVNFALKSLL